MNDDEDTQADPAKQPPMTVALADGLFWNAKMQTVNYGKWYTNLTKTTVEEDVADGIPQLVGALRFANARGLKGFA